MDKSQVLSLWFMHTHKCTIVAKDAYVQTNVSKHEWGQGSNYWLQSGNMYLLLHLRDLISVAYSGKDEKRETSDEGQSVSMFLA